MRSLVQRVPLVLFFLGHWKYQSGLSSRFARQPEPGSANRQHVSRPARQRLLTTLIEWLRKVAATDHLLEVTVHDAPQVPPAQKHQNLMMGSQEIFFPSAYESKYT